MTGKMHGVALAGIGFGLYRFAVSHLYGSGLGAPGDSVGFVSNLPFVLAMNLTSCAVALVVLALLRAGSFRGGLASPWAASLILLAGTALGQLGDLSNGTAIGIAQGITCGVGLLLLSIAWLDIFIGQPSAAQALAQLIVGTTLYTAAECAAAFIPVGLHTVLAGGALVASAGLSHALRSNPPDTAARRSRMSREELHHVLPTLASFFVLVGVVGIMHTSVIGSSSEYVIGAVPMWLARLVSLVVFLAVILISRQRFNLEGVFRVAFPCLIAVMTLLPFLGAPLGSLTGSLAIVCYCVFGMLFYLFLIREGRRLELSSALLASIYTPGSSGFLFAGLCVGLGLQAVSASLDASLLTLLAFAAIYPLALALALFLRRNPKQAVPSIAQPADNPNAPDQTEESEGPRGVGLAQRPRAPHSMSSRTFDAAVGAVAQSCGLTAREREVLSYLAGGRSVRYIAETLVISENTAWTHTKRIYAKTKTHSKDELMSLVEEWGQTLLH